MSTEVCPLLHALVDDICVPYRDIIGASKIWGSLSLIPVISVAEAIVLCCFWFPLRKASSRSAVWFATLFLSLAAIIRAGYYGDPFQLYGYYPYGLERIYWDLPFWLVFLVMPVLLMSLLRAVLASQGKMNSWLFQFSENGVWAAVILNLCATVVPMLINRIVELVRWYSLEPNDFDGQWHVFVVHNRIACFFEYGTWWLYTAFQLALFVPLFLHFRRHQV